MPFKYVIKYEEWVSLLSLPRRCGIRILAFCFLKLPPKVYHSSLPRRLCCSPDLALFIFFSIDLYFPFDLNFSNLEAVITHSTLFFSVPKFQGFRKCAQLLYTLLPWAGFSVFPHLQPAYLIWICIFRIAPENMPCQSIHEVWSSWVLGVYHFHLA